MKGTILEGAKGGESFGKQYATNIYTRSHTDTHPRPHILA